MAALNPSIILAGDKPDYLGSFTRGVSAREVFDKQKSAKEKRNFLKDYGADLYSGDEGALEAYSQHDLEGAMALKGHFDQKKAMAARAAQAGQARQREKELASIQTSMGNVEQLRDWADKQENPSVAFNNALGGVLKPETVQRFNDAGIDLSYENIETAGMQVANATGTKWSGRASTDPQDAADLQYKQAQTENLQSQIADRDKVETPADYTLDGVRYSGETNEPISKGPPKVPSLTSAEAAIARSVANGIPQDIAQKIEDGVYATSRHPVSGVVQVVDKSSGKVVFDGDADVAEVPAQVVEAPTVNDPTQASDVGAIPQGADYAGSFGLGGAVDSFFNTAADIIGVDLPNEETERGIQAVTNLEVRTKILLADAFPGRPSVHIMQMLDEITAKPKQIMMGEGKAKIKLSQTRDLINEALRLNQDIVNNKSKYRPLEVSAANKKIGDLVSIRTDYDTILRSMNKSEVAKEVTFEQFKKLDVGEKYLRDGVEYIKGEP